MDCWASALGDCDGKQSREHYISQGVFDEKTVFATGQEWCKNPKKIGLGQATARILCEKHNSLLSDYDAEAMKLSKFLLEQTRDRPTESRHIKLNGRLLEKWAFKIAINLSYLGVFGTGNNIPTMEHLLYLYRNEEISNGMVTLPPKISPQ